MNKEQIVATTSTLELANTLRNLLLKKYYFSFTEERATPRVYHNKDKNEYTITLVSLLGKKINEELVLDAIEAITDFYREQIEEESRYEDDHSHAMDVNTNIFPSFTSTESVATSTKSLLN